MHQLHVELAGLLQGATDRLLGDLVEHHPFHRHLRCQQLQQVPADALAFAVFVRSQQQLIRPLEGVLQFFDHLFLVLRHHVERLEVLGGVDAEVCPLLALVGGWNLAGVVRQVAHMPHRGLHTERLGQKATDGAGLGGALDDDQGVSQRKGGRPLPSLSHRSTGRDRRRAAPLQSAATDRALRRSHDPVRSQPPRR